MVRQLNKLLSTAKTNPQQSPALAVAGGENQLWVLTEAETEAVAGGLLPGIGLFGPRPMPEA